MTHLFAPTLALHIGAGLLAAVVGVLPILTKKGSRLHRLSGRVFATLMAILLACAWLMTAIHFNAYFAGLTTTATLALFSGLRVLGRKRPDIRKADRAKPLDWIVTGLTLGVGVWIAVLVLTGRAEARPVLFAVVAGALLNGGWDLWRFAAPTAWPFSPRLWTYEHLFKMLGAYGAVLAAFSGNFLTFLPAPWSQLWPTVFFQTLSIGWIAWLATRRRPTPSPA